MLQKIYLLIREDQGQALVEAPLIVLFCTVCVLLLLQPGLTMLVRTIMGHSVGSLVRENSVASSAKVALTPEVFKQHLLHSLSVLPASPYFFDPQSLEVKLGGVDGSGWCSVSLKVEQKPLPIIGPLLKRGTNSITIEERTKVLDTLTFSDRNFDKSQLIIGAEQ